MKKILVVDDSGFYRKLLIDELRKIEKMEFEGVTFDIVEAEDRVSALQQIAKFKPDLVFLDIVMKENEYEGVQILETLTKSNSEIKVVVLSSVGQESVVKKCKILGVTDYIEKPFDHDQILKALRKNFS